MLGSSTALSSSREAERRRSGQQRCRILLPPGLGALCVEGEELVFPVRVRAERTMTLYVCLAYRTVLRLADRKRPGTQGLRNHRMWPPCDPRPHAVHVPVLRPGAMRHA